MDGDGIAGRIPLLQYMRKQTKPTRLSIRSTEDLLGTVPVVLGFHPTDSLVLLVVSDGELQVAARCDLEDAITPGGAAELVGRLWFQYPEADALALAYSSSQEDAWAALDAVTEGLPFGARAVRLQVVSGQYLTEPGGKPHPYRMKHPGEAADLPVLQRRADLAAGLEPRFPDSELREAAVAAADLDAEWAAVQAARLLAGDELDAVGAAVVARACSAQDFVEGIIGSICRTNARDLVEVWRQAASGVLPELSGPALGVLAIASWVAGDGALTNVCLERALAEEYWDAWLDLADLVMIGAIHPRVWDDLRAAYLEDVGFRV